MDCTRNGCKQERVSGQLYCEDDLLERQVRVQQAEQQATTRGTGTLADLIRKAKASGQIALTEAVTVTTGSGYQKTA